MELLPFIFSTPILIIGILISQKYSTIIREVNSERNKNLRTYSPAKLKEMQNRIFLNIGALLLIMGIMLACFIVIGTILKLLFPNYFN